MNTLNSQKYEHAEQHCCFYLLIYELKSLYETQNVFTLGATGGAVKQFAF